MSSRYLTLLSGQGRFYRIAFALAVVVYLVTAFYSHGYYYADEHYQIIEFAGYLCGFNSEDQLAWEFDAQIRAAVQPVIAFMVFRLLSFFSITDPYTLAFALRLLSACLALLVIMKFVRNTIGYFPDEKEKKAYFLLSFFLWFMPFISVRFSGETWSGLFLLLSMAMIPGSDRSSLRPFLMGMTFGLAFIFRFQIGFAIVGILLWIIIFQKKDLTYILKIAASFAAVLLVGFLIDTWFYGEPVFTPWKYFMSVIRSGGTGYGTSPWYFYIAELVQFPTYFIGIPLVFSLILIIIYEPKNLYLWTFIIFILVHSLVPHKEERFLFPVFYLIPVLLMTGYMKLKLLLDRKKIFTIFMYVLSVIFVIINMGGLITMSRQSAAKGRLSISKYIHDRYPGEHINIIYTYWANPYRPFQGLYSRFYLEEKMTHQFIGDLYNLNDSLTLPDAVDFLVVRKEEVRPDNGEALISGNRFVLVKQSIPDWTEWMMNTVYTGFKEGNVLLLYLYDPLQKSYREE